MKDTVSGHKSKRNSENRENHTKNRENTYFNIKEFQRIIK